jgi:diguanylate cyclase (GGDEF)-like protein
VDVLRRYHQRTIVLFLTLVIALAAWSMHIYGESTQNIRSRVIEQQRVLAIQAANGIDTHLYWLELELKRLATSPVWRTSNLDAWHATLRELLAFGGEIQIQDVGYIDANGILQAMARTPQMEGQNYSLLGYFQRSHDLDSDRTVYEVITYHTGKAWEKGLIMAQPVRLADGKFGGVVLFTLRLADLITKFLPPTSVDGGAIWLADELGQVYHPSRPLGFPVSMLFTDEKAYQELLRDARKGERFNSDIAAPEGKSQIVSIMPLKMAGKVWSVVVSTPGDLARMQTRHIFTDYVAFFLVAGGISLVNLFFHTRMIRQTHQELEEEIQTRKMLQEKMKHLAQHDNLTKLPNRWLFSDRLTQALTQAKRIGNQVAVLFLDLDRFKPINDNLGHDVGDGLLLAVAQQAKGCVREMDTVARLGGDEFGVILSGVDSPEEAAVVAEKIVHALHQPFLIKGHDCQIGVSIGIALYPDHGDEANLLLQRADIAMYGAKDRGRNQYQFFENVLEERHGDNGRNGGSVRYDERGHLSGI